MLKLAFRNIFRHGFRTALTLTAIVFGVIGLILSGGFVEDVLIQLREATIHSQIGHIQILRKGYTEFGRREPFDYLLEDTDKLRALIKPFPELDVSMTRLSCFGLANNGKTDRPVFVEGVEPEAEARLGSFISIIEGKPLTDADSYGTIVGKGLAKSLKLKPGDTLTLLVTTPDGAMNSGEFVVSGIFQSFSREYDDRALRIPLGAAQELLTTSGAHSVVLALRATELTDQVAERLRAALPADQYEVKTWFELAEFFRNTVALYRQQFGVLQLIVLMMVLLSVANSVNMAVFERTGEFGTLMAVGKRRTSVLALILLEYALLGAIGAVIGVTAGVGLAMVVEALQIPMPPPPGSDVGYIAGVDLDVTLLVMAALVGFLASVAGAFLPGRRASQLPVVDALRANI